MLKTIIFNKTGYDPFIDFIKAYAIICVLIGHTLPVSYMGYGFWAGMQVPLFILVQSFHFYKKDEARLNFKKLLQRIILPFMAIGLLEFVVLCITGWGGQNLTIELFKSGGGYGPGSYFPFIYIQIALLLPIFRRFFDNLNSFQLFLWFLIFAEGMEFICSLTELPEWLYRLLAIRYVFLIYLGWIWCKKGIELNFKMIALSVSSALSIFYFDYVASYFQINNEPWFFNTGWTFHRWPCYYYCANGLVYLLYVVWQQLQKNDTLIKCIKLLAKSSYEVFLVQMAVIALFKVDAFSSIENTYVRFSLWLVFVWCVSIFGGMYINKVYKRIIG